MVGPGQVIERFTYIGIFCLLILGGAGFPFPEDAVLIMSGALISHGFTKLAPAGRRSLFGSADVGHEIIEDRPGTGLFPLFRHRRGRVCVQDGPLYTVGNGTLHPAR